ncbi:histidine kinase [Vibrio splendidus]|uniref:ATP-binding protein n=1 Tax=Vibrio splendidus TaxID=29497 RepID=UPI000D38398D|nr:ATP-binding protein [Vibrio splendidus]PTP82379.1 histidine kinase [Vibrio splendidus]
MTQNSTRKSVSFKAQARTIDHLGKGQIADAPTAISELWKNSYDAYARDVALHLFDGDIKCGAIIDNGCGMTYEQLSDSWLTIGTASKTKKKLLPEEDRFGLADRFTQGEKGIGRLSTAFLAPVTLIVTKKANTQYSAALIDWRLFENTYLGLHDIKVPMQEFSDLDYLTEVCKGFQTEMLRNLALEPQTEDEKILRRMWQRFTEDELEAFQLRHNPKDSDVFISTEDKVSILCEQLEFDKNCVHTWKALLDKTENNGEGKHGTALFLIDLNRDLSLLTNRGDVSRESEEYKAIKKDVVDTLHAFVDPYKEQVENTDFPDLDDNALNFPAVCWVREEFNYSIIPFERDGSEAKTVGTIVDGNDVFGNKEFKSLEHQVIGEIDEKGWFRGDVIAFGELYKDIIFPCRTPSMEEVTKAGAFDIRLGTFEFEFSKSTHSRDDYDTLKSLVEKHSGLMVFRDGLRVLPYGRPDNDFFEIEENRSKNAGRYYWASRRLFGHISLDQKMNQRLKDKAGREGFVKNQAAREFKVIVKSLLKQLADKFFGRNSEERKILLEQLKKDKKNQTKARSKSAKITKQAFTESIDSNLPRLNLKVESVRGIHQDLEKGIELSLHRIDELVDEVSKLEELLPEFKTPNKPASMNDSLEEKYRGYRDLFGELGELLVTCRERLNKLEIMNQTRSPMESAQNKYDSSNAAVKKQVNKYVKTIEETLEALQTTWRKEARNDKEAYEAQATPLLDSVTNTSDVELTLNTLDKIYREQADDIASKYEGFLQALIKLEQGVDLESAFTLADEERARAAQEVEQIRGLAQSGISFEILAHELAVQDQAVTRSLNSMSSSAKKEPGFTNAMRAHKQFTDYLRFLSPLKLSGYQQRDDISGLDIIKNIQKFFNDQFEQQNVHLEFGDNFKQMNIVDVQSRVIPVFVNLLNNALYWVGLAENERVIKVDIIDDLVVIANNGPVIDPDDIENLFQLFYSRRPSGNGVGLYLSKQNLAVARHKIWYAEKPEEKLIQEGANFVIQFRGMEVK